MEEKQGGLDSLTSFFGAISSPISTVLQGVLSRKVQLGNIFQGLEDRLLMREQMAAAEESEERAFINARRAADEKIVLIIVIGILLLAGLIFYRRSK